MKQIQQSWNFVLSFDFFKECDQVHVEDVASDDNGQELRSVTRYTANEQK